MEPPPADECILRVVGFNVNKCESTLAHQQATTESSRTREVDIKHTGAHTHPVVDEDRAATEKSLFSAPDTVLPDSNSSSSSCYSTLYTTIVLPPGELARSFDDTQRQQLMLRQCNDLATLAKRYECEDNNALSGLLFSNSGTKPASSTTSDFNSGKKDSCISNSNSCCSSMRSSLSACEPYTPQLSTDILYFEWLAYARDHFGARTGAGGGFEAIIQQPPSPTPLTTMDAAEL
jgi:hypothetical protein